MSTTATDAARAAADIVLTEPGLSTIVHGIVIARCIFVRIRNFVTYRIAATLQLLTFFFIAVYAFRPVRSFRITTMYLCIYVHMCICAYVYMCMCISLTYPLIVYLHQYFVRCFSACVSVRLYAYLYVRVTLIMCRTATFLLSMLSSLLFLDTENTDNPPHICFILTIHTIP